MDRRQHRRFDLKAPVTFTWRAKGETRRADGVTRDVSETGLFVVTDFPPPSGTVVRVEVSFPLREDSQIQMKAQGKVVRVEAGGYSNTVQGFAAATRISWLHSQAFNPSKGIRTGLGQQR